MKTNYVNSILLSIALMTCHQFALAQRDGCSATLGAKPSGHFQITSYSGNSYLDAFLTREVNVLRNFFDVNPSVFYYDDGSEGANARAMPAVEHPAYPSGTVILGLNMIVNEFNLSASGTTVPLIMAHEFGHILDYKENVCDDYDVKTAELFADFMAGCFLYYRHVLIYTDTRAAIATFYNKGGYEFNNPDHHGTPDERVAALMAGYNWLQSVARPGVYISPSQAIDAAKDYLEISEDGSGSTTSGGSARLVSNSALKENITIITRLADTQSGGSGVTFTYKITVVNNNDVDVTVTLGGLSYGTYANCNATRSSYQEEGEIDEETVSVSANSREIVEVSVHVDESPPYSCAGVKQHQNAQVVAVSDY
jgi:hypothetical protein